MTKAMKGEERRFLVGYLPFDPRMGITVWGRLSFLAVEDREYEGEDYCDLMSRQDAEEAVKTLEDEGAVVFEVKPVGRNKR